MTWPSYRHDRPEDGWEEIIKLIQGWHLNKPTQQPRWFFALEQVLRGGRQCQLWGQDQASFHCYSFWVLRKSLPMTWWCVAVQVSPRKILNLNPGSGKHPCCPRRRLKGVETEADVLWLLSWRISSSIWRMLIVWSRTKAIWSWVALSSDKGHGAWVGWVSWFSFETHMIQGEWNACVFKKDQGMSPVWLRLACSSIFVKGLSSSPVTIETRKPASTQVWWSCIKRRWWGNFGLDDGIKRLCVVNVEARQLELIEELVDNVNCQSKWPSHQASPLVAELYSWQRQIRRHDLHFRLSTVAEAWQIENQKACLEDIWI